MAGNYNNIESAMRGSDTADLLSFLFEQLGVKRGSDPIQRGFIKSIERQGLNLSSLQMVNRRVLSENLNTDQTMDLVKQVKRLQEMSTSYSPIGPSMASAPYVRKATYNTINQDFIKKLALPEYGREPGYVKDIEDQIKTLSKQGDIEGLYKELNSEVAKRVAVGGKAIDKVQAEVADFVLTDKEKLNKYAYVKPEKTTPGVLPASVVQQLTEIAGSPGRYSEQLRAGATERYFESELNRRQKELNLGGNETEIQTNIGVARRNMRNLPHLAQKSLYANAILNEGMDPTDARAMYDEQLNNIDMQSKLSPWQGVIKYEGYKTTQGRLRGGLFFGADVIRARKAGVSIPTGTVAAVAGVEGARLAIEAYKMNVENQYAGQFLQSGEKGGISQLSALGYGVDFNQLLKAYQTSSALAIPGLNVQQQTDLGINGALATGRSIDSIQNLIQQQALLGASKPSIDALNTLVKGGFNGVNQTQITSLQENLTGMGLPMRGTPDQIRRQAQVYSNIAKKVPGVNQVLPLIGALQSSGQIASIGYMAGQSRESVNAALQSGDFMTQLSWFSKIVSPGGVLGTGDFQSRLIQAQGYSPGMTPATLQNLIDINAAGLTPQSVQNTNSQEVMTNLIGSTLKGATNTRQGALFSAFNQGSNVPGIIQALSGFAYQDEAANRGLTVDQYAILQDIKNNPGNYSGLNSQQLISTLQQQYGFNPNAATPNEQAPWNQLVNTLQSSLSIKIDQNGNAYSYSSKSANGTTVNQPIPQSPANQKLSQQTGRSVENWLGVAQ